MQQRFHAAEQTAEEGALPLSTSERVTALQSGAELDSDARAEVQEQSIIGMDADNSLETLLAAHKRQSRRYALLENTALALGGGFLFFGLCALFLAFGSGTLLHPLSAVSIDFSLTSWGVKSNYSGSWHTTVSGLTPLLLLIGALLCARRVKQERLKLAWQLTQYDDVRGLGPLIEALYMRDRVISNMVTPHLVRLLPHLCAENAHCVNENQRLLLRLYLGRSKRNLLWNNDALSVAIIETFAQIGDGTELPTMRRLAAGKGCIGANGEVQRAAQAYLEEIKRRSEQEQQAQTLLRGAESTLLRTAPDVLLRPASPVSETSPEQLLRPTTSDTPS